MRTIIAATDFSAAASNACNYAADMAIALQNDLLLVHVYQEPSVYTAVPLVFTREEMRRQAAVNITQLQQKLTRKAAGKIKVEIALSAGSFFQVLQSVCEKSNPYAVVMGSHGTTTPDRSASSSHTIQTMKNLEWPVIAVPPGNSFSGIKKIGLACDFDQVGDSFPLEEIALLVRDFKAALHILDTSRQQVFTKNGSYESEKVQQSLKSLHPGYHFVNNQHTDDAIIHFAENNHIDLLMVLPKRLSLIDKLLHRNSTRNLVLHSHVPVMALQQPSLLQ
jgi:nucleotide-binding universal stress UspA family protein